MNIEKGHPAAHGHLPVSSYIYDPDLQELFRDIERAEDDPAYVPVRARPIELPGWFKGIIEFFKRIG